MDMLEILLEAAHTARAVINPYLVGEKPLSIERKADGSRVTAADKEAQAAIYSVARRRVPGCAFIGEEGSNIDMQGLQEGDIVFVVDPIDGTSSFIDGLDTWAISMAVGVVKNGKIAITAAVVDAPAWGEGVTYFAEAGAAYRAEHKAWQPKKLSLPQSAEETAEVHAFLHKLPGETLPGALKAALQKEYALERGGSPALSLARLAAGELLAVVVREEDPITPTGEFHIWDSIAGRFIAEQAGAAIPAEIGHHGLLRVQDSVAFTVMAQDKDTVNAIAARMLEHAFAHAVSTPRRG